MLVFRGVHATLSKNELSFISTGLEGLLHQLNSRCFWKENTCISSVDALWFNCLPLFGHHLRRLRELKNRKSFTLPSLDPPSSLSDDEKMFLCDDIHPNMICLGLQEKRWLALRGFAASLVDLSVFCSHQRTSETSRRAAGSSMERQCQISRWEWIQQTIL